MKVTTSSSGQQRSPQRPQAPTPAPRPAPRPQQPVVASNMGDEDEDLTAFERVIKFVRTKWKIILPVTLVLVIAVVYWFSHSASSARANGFAPSRSPARPPQRPSLRAPTALTSSS